MSRRMLIAATLLAVVVLVGAVLLDRSVRPGEAGGPASAGRSDAVPSAEPTPATDAPPTIPPRPDATDPATPDGMSGGVEVLPPVTDSEPGLPAPVEYSPIVAPPMPAAASASGSLVAGFPERVPVYAGSRIEASSVTGQGERLQAALDATAEVDPRTVLDFYTAAFAALGLQGTTAPAVGGSTVLQFVRGGDAITVTVTPAAADTRYTVFGTFTVAKG